MYSVRQDKKITSISQQSKFYLKLFRKKPIKLCNSPRARGERGYERSIHWINAPNRIYKTDRLQKKTQTNFNSALGNIYIYIQQYIVKLGQLILVLSHSPQSWPLQDLLFCLCSVGNVCLKYTPTEIVCLVRYFSKLSKSLCARIERLWGYQIKPIHIILHRNMRL